MNNRSRASKRYKKAGQTLEVQLAVLLLRNRMTVAVAESCTGGLICHRITSVPGSSAFFLGGIVAYSNEVKIKHLRVDKKLLQKYGAVDCRIAQMMAVGIQRKMKSDIGVGVTGIAGPGGGTSHKPVGLVYIAVAMGNKCNTVECRFKGDRSMIKELTSTKALEMTIQFVIQHFGVGEINNKGDYYGKKDNG